MLSNMRFHLYGIFHWVIQKFDGISTQVLDDNARDEWSTRFAMASVVSYMQYISIGMNYLMYTLESIEKAVIFHIQWQICTFKRLSFYFINKINSDHHSQTTLQTDHVDKNVGKLRWMNRFYSMELETMHRKEIIIKRTNRYLNFGFEKTKPNKGNGLFLRRRVKAVSPNYGST